MSLAFEITPDDIQNIAAEHDTQLTYEQACAVMDEIDLDIAENAALSYDSIEDQTSAAYSCIEHQMIAEGLYICEPIRYPMP